MMLESTFSDTLSMLRPLKPGRVWKLRRPPAPLPQPDADDRLVAETAAAMALFLGGEAAAHDAAARASRRLVRAGVADAAADAAVQALDLAQAQAALAAALATGPAWLALPYNSAGLALFRELPQSVAAPVVVVHAPQLDAALAGRLYGARFCSAAEAVRRARAALVATPAPQLFVSFPELHAWRADTTARVGFLGQPCRFAVTEALLSALGLPQLLTLGVAAGGTAAQLVAWTPPQGLDATRQQRTAQALAWLVGQLQATAAAWPGHSGAWLHWQAATEQVLELQRDNRLRQFEAFLDAWQREGQGLSPELHQQARARLRELQRAAAA